jgi:hypothetical protein
LRQTPVEQLPFALWVSTCPLRRAAWSDHPAGERITTFLPGITMKFERSTWLIARCLVFWRNLDDESGLADYRMIHSGAPVEKGTKLTLASWQRERPFPRDLASNVTQRQTQEESEARYGEKA